jgi:hypothetical protein
MVKIKVKVMTMSIAEKGHVRENRPLNLGQYQDHGHGQYKGQGGWAMFEWDSCLNTRIKGHGHDYD